MAVYKLKSKVWLYPGMAGWHFINVPAKQSKGIKAAYGKGRPGFGSIRVEATIGKTRWSSSIFPDKKSGTYLLPLKAQVRKKEGITAHQTISFTIRIVG